MSIRLNSVRAVLDTNVWLDWLVFDDAGVAPIVQRIEDGALQVLGTPAMRNEWIAVIARPRFALDAAAQHAALAAYDRVVRSCDDAAHAPLQCRDPNDQMFIDLALAERVHWLITKDKALLALRRSARLRYGLAIGSPADAALLQALHA